MSNQYEILGKAPNAVDLKKLSPDTTLIIISHRLSSISGADNIIVIENGRLTQEGKHAKLIQENGLYKEMWEKQKRYKSMEQGTDFNG